MIETLIGFGGQLLNASSQAAGVFSAMSGIAHGRTLQEIKAVLRQQEQRLVSIEQGIWYAPSAHNVLVSSRSDEIAEIRRMVELLTSVRDILRTEVISAAPLRTPIKLQEELEHNVWDCLHDIRPVAKANFDRTPDWVPLTFEHCNQLFVGWQKRGMLKSVLGIDFKTHPEAWCGRAKRSVPRVVTDNMVQEFYRRDLKRPSRNFTRSGDGRVLWRTGTVVFFSPNLGAIIEADHDGADVFVSMAEMIRSGVSRLELYQRVKFQWAEVIDGREGPLFISESAT